MWHRNTATSEVEQDSRPKHGPSDQASLQIRACLTTHQVYPAAPGSLIPTWLGADVRAVQHAFPLGSQSPRSCWLIFGGCGTSRGLVPTGKRTKKLLDPPHSCYSSLGWAAGAHLVPRGETLPFGVTYYMIFSCKESVTVG